MLAPMAASSYTDVKDSLRHLHLEEPRPWLVGFSGGKDSTMLASVMPRIWTIFEGCCFNDACRQRHVHAL